MQGAWIISRPLSAVGGKGVEDVPEGGTAPVMQLSDFAACLEAIAARSPDPLAMWRAGEAMHLADMGGLGCALALAPTLGAAIKALQRCFGAMQSASAVAFEVEDDRASFSYRILDNDIWPRRADSELTLGVVAGIIRRFAPDAERVCSLAFEHEPGAARTSFATHTAGPVRMSETNIISFPARLLDRGAEPVSVSDTSRAFRDAVQALGAQIRADWLRQPTSHRVLHTLMSRIGRDPIDQDAVASHLGVSRRTLRRQLDTEGTSFHELTEICRCNVGHALLVRSELPMIEIAMRLGYSDHTAFSRAFSRWFGASPRELRKAGSAVRVTT
ncbi:helix-turn-helix domain-containing protein [Paracoccus niistensis]|uniref:Helix-turn-helix domain-containing protein n=2 Tax=Paracoccus niistensis TaxID=632935 RepID=A0ABV6I105_9RHOB